MESLSRAQARRVALVAQGFRDPRHTVPTLRTVDRTLARTGLLQVDSVNVLQRAHYMPLFSRMGSYDVDLLRRAGSGTPSRPRRLVEYWAHVQALMPVELWPVMRHRMEEYRARRGKWWPVADTRPGLEADVLAAVRARGPVTARDLEDELGGGARTREHWGWNWSEARKVLDFLYMVGDLAIAGRNDQFEVRYDLPERVIPARVLDLPTPTRADADRELVRRAARSHGVGTARCLADYYRMRVTDARRAIRDLVDAGELVQVEVEGWRGPTYLHRDARVPRRVDARALLSPFDPVVWERQRTERLFDFHYRIEIYVPAEKRVHGYYVLPFLLGSRLVGRVDLKADRKQRALQVKAAYAEPGAPPETAAELAAELRELAGWLGVDDVRVERQGDLSGPLLEELR
ncbi:winged helix-turn-helix domain-containing protein [Nocardioides terrisoli]|uniref:winged helix-turn-helix domain-containing protein n=1 Tax=Nocardioides terrisoli TaxID=3388267 RepID=UPI00287B92C5|nr:crosslink repair DNA glycosylase YcaQ family protein [Nocardioides marmorisolisilvae]